jgi:hypothetical protein
VDDEVDQFVDASLLGLAYRVRQHGDALHFLEGFVLECRELLERAVGAAQARGRIEVLAALR